MEDLKEVILSRFSDNGLETIGMLSVVGDRFHCDSLERPWKNNARGISCIPPGRYRCTWARMVTVGTDHYLVQDVPGRSAIFIHGGNYFLDSHGCILLGSKAGDLNKDGQEDIGNSRNTIHAFEELMERKDFWLTIE